jgi:glycosyltransferase involved in cell wall biosynthesis
MTKGIDHRVGAVVIGRNEGERLRRCLASVRRVIDDIVYVDSGSSDGSVDLARSMGAVVVALDPTTPFTAARARNAGVAELRRVAPGVTLMQFIDGDCELDPQWIARATDAIEMWDRTAVVCGRRRERHRGATVYNRLCDIEWNTPVGEANSCGGDSLMRLAPFSEVGGFRSDLIAGEEPELCLRLRERGWKIRRIDVEMTVHDAAMTRALQWWKRAARAGFAYAEGHSLHGRGPSRYRRRELRSIVLWGLVLPVSAIAAAWFTFGISLVMLAGAYALLWLKIYGSQLKRCGTSFDANLYAASCVVGKFANLAGVLSFHWHRRRGTRRAIIEYKGEVPLARGPRGGQPA